MSWSPAKKMLRDIAVYCCVAFFLLYLFRFTSAKTPGFCSERCHKLLDGSWFSCSLVQKRGGLPFGLEMKVKICDFLNGHVLLWISWTCGGSQNCEMGISWKGETLRNCFFCFYNSVLRENFPFKAVVLLKIWMRCLPAAVWDALERNICRRGSEESGDCLTTCLIQGAQVETYLPSMGGLFPKAFFNDSGGTSPTDFQSCAKRCCRSLVLIFLPLPKVGSGSWGPSRNDIRRDIFCAMCQLETLHCDEE